MEKSLAKNSDVKIGDLRIEKNGAVKAIAGLITQVKMITTKKGDPMAFLTVEDMDSSVEVVVFPSIFSKYREAIVEDKIIKIKGRIDSKEEEPKILAMDLEGIDKKKMRRSDKLESLVVSLDPQLHGRDTISHLKKIFASYPGSNPVFMELRDGNGSTKFKLGKDYFVEASNKLMSELIELLGESSVSLV
jgi:DNA polymerase-3 subunit alpha